VARLGNPKRRLRVGLFVMAFVLSLFVGRLLQLQGIDASAYAAQAEEKRLARKVLLATRGSITDTHGVALATTVPTVNVKADPRRVRDPAKTAGILAPILRVDAAVLQAKLSASGKKWVYLAKGVDSATWNRIRQVQRAERSAAAKAKGSGKPAQYLEVITSEPSTRRAYPPGSMAANVIGFVDSSGHGLGGLEKKLDPVLAGRDGEISYEKAVGGAAIPGEGASEQDPVPGRTVQLTIDRDVQWMAQQAIARQVKASGAESGTVVVMQPQTGEILALATAPSFDPNKYASSPPKLLGNRGLSEVYEPGSTGKVITMAAALEQRAAAPTTRVVVPPTLRRGGRTIHDHSTHGTLRLTAAGVLAKSSNIGTVLIGERLGRDRLYDYLTRFGIGQPTGMEFPGESRGILARPRDWSRVQWANVSFGQGYSLNAVQATAVYATIANGGVRVQPSLIKAIGDQGGNLVPVPAPRRTRVVSEATARKVAEMLEVVVSDDGTAPMARIPGYRVAGKTGTAQRHDDKCRCYRGFTASFIGFAPADKPSVVVSVTLQDPRRGHYGGMLGGPVFKEVTSFALQTLRVPPTGTRPPRIPVKW
jgi:cell division protein FtsI (penicillin-binding protein 3)